MTKWPHLRSFPGGVLGLLLAVALLGLRLIAPVQAGAVPVAASAFLDLAICHSPSSGDPAPPPPAPPDDACQLCPACHLLSGPVLLPGASWVPVPQRATLGSVGQPAAPRSPLGQARHAPRARGPPVLA